MTLELTSPGDFSLLSASGPDARRFLQGQLTCNLDELSGQRSLPGAYCNLKGRVIADFLLIDAGSQLLLRCAPGMADVLRERLAKYAVFFKVELNEVSVRWQRSAVIGEAAGQSLAASRGIELPRTDWSTVTHEDVIAVRVRGENPRWELLFPTDGSLAGQGDMDDTHPWKLEDIRAGIIHVTSARSEQFTPQVLNYDLDGTISFRKGCYTGQEVVARMHYRGKAGKRLYRLLAQTAVDGDALAEWQVLSTDPSLSARGEILEQESDGKAAELLAILPRQLAEQPAGSLCLSPRDQTSGEIGIDQVVSFEQ